MLTVKRVHARMANDHEGRASLALNLPEPRLSQVAAAVGLTLSILY